MSQASLRAKSPRRGRKKRSTFRRRSFGGQQLTFDRGLAATDLPGLNLGNIVDVVNSLLRRIYQPRGQ